MTAVHHLYDILHYSIYHMIEITIVIFFLWWLVPAKHSSKKLSKKVIESGTYPTAGRIHNVLDSTVSTYNYICMYVHISYMYVWICENINANGHLYVNKHLGLISCKILQWSYFDFWVKHKGAMHPRSVCVKVYGKDWWSIQNLIFDVHTST